MSKFRVAHLDLDLDRNLVSLLFNLNQPFRLMMLSVLVACPLRTHPVAVALALHPQLYPPFSTARPNVAALPAATA